MKTEIKVGRQANFSYTNHEGKTEDRRMIVQAVSYGNFPMHEGLIWVVEGYCLDRKAYRSFDIAHIDMKTWRQ